MSLDLTTVETPHLRLLPELTKNALYGVKAHVIFTARNPQGKREDIRMTQDVNAANLASMIDCGFTSQRWIDGKELNVLYRSNASAYEGIKEAKAELIEEGYEDVLYSSDGILLILDEMSVRRLIKKGVMQTKGA